MNKVTTSNASKLTTYELRQELVKRNCFDLKEGDVCYKNMLQRLMVELVKEESSVEESRVESAAQAYKEDIDKAKLERERKKQEAIERSKLRQSQPGYFQQKAESNIKPEVVAIESEPNKEDEGNVEDESRSVDPFRISSGKSKIFVR